MQQKIVNVFKILLLWILVSPSIAISQTYSTDLDNLYLMDFTPGACSATFIASFTVAGTGASIQMSDLALCPDGILYGVDYFTFFGRVYEINPATGVSTVITTFPNGGYNGLACSPDFRLFTTGGGSFGGQVREVFPGSGTNTLLGSTGLQSAGDLVFYNGVWYHSVEPSGILEIPNIDDPSNHTMIFSGGPYLGITVSPDKCNTLIVPDAQYSELNLETNELTVICNIGQLGQEGLTSMFEFQDPPECVLIIDLDDDDSSGLPDADYLGDTNTCITEDGLNIADEDVLIESQKDIADITINIENGLLDPPDEILVLTFANNITIIGSGTDQIILSNNGAATIADFELALSQIKYINLKDYPTPGIREILVVVEDVDGALSNDAIGFITVSEYEDAEVDLGPDITVCDGEVVFLTASQGETFIWSTSEQTQTITTNSAGVYTVTVTDGIKCPATDEIEVFHLPYIEFFLSTDPICSGEDLIIEIFTLYQGVFDIELKDVNTNELYYFQNVMNGDFITISDIDNAFLEINQILPFIEDICPIDATGIFEVIVEDVIVDMSSGFICQNDSIFYRGVYLKEAGEYLDTIMSDTSCDSLLIFNLEVHPIFIDTILQFSCDSIDIGFFTDTLSTSFGCDSIISLDILLSPSHDTTVVSTSCDFEQVIDTTFLLMNEFGCDSMVHYIVNYSLSDTIEIETLTCIPAEVDTVVQELTSMDGCDSIVINFINLSLPDSIYIDLITCDSSASGLIVITEINANGCDSLIFENYIYQAPSTETFQNIVCDSIDQGSNIDTIMSAFGCDSIFVLTENIYTAPDSIMFVQSSCDPQNVGVTYNTLVNINGCDSIIEEISIILESLDTVFLQGETCNSTLAGTVIDTLTTTEDCDSIVQTELFYVPLDTTYLVETSCNIDFVGIDNILLITTEGCDSIVQTEVIYNPLDTTNVFETSCHSDSVGIYHTVLDSEEGCDSIIARFVSFIPHDTVYSMMETCDIALDNTLDTLTFETEECDSLVIIESHYVGADTTFLSGTTCDENEAGLSTINLPNSFGCDSIIVYDIILMPSQNIFITDTICYITNESIETLQLTNQFGCDSLITIEKVYQAPNLDLGLDQTILLGDEIFLEVNTSIIDGDFIWSSDPFIDPEEFDDFLLMPEEDVIVTLEILSSEGCTAIDDINIVVEKEFPLIFPNVFSPNGDGANDIYTFDLNDLGIESIESLSIFDRWGNKVYKINNANNTTSFGWDGSFNGQNVESGVYVMFAKLTLVTGERVAVTQDVAVIY